MDGTELVEGAVTAEGCGVGGLLVIAGTDVGEAPAADVRDVAVGVADVDVAAVVVVAVRADGFVGGVALPVADWTRACTTLVQPATATARRPNPAVMTRRRDGVEGIDAGYRGWAGGPVGEPSVGVSER